MVDFFEGERKDKMQHIKRYAVATKRGILVDEHFGFTEKFQIYETDGETVTLLEDRTITPFCKGSEECDSFQERLSPILEALKDCAGVLALRIGIPVAQELYRAGILSYTLCEEIPTAIQQVYNGNIASLY